MLKTSHKIFFQSATQVDQIPDESVALVITSPPYPMIEMWDESFSQQNPQIRTALDQNDGMQAFDLMHAELKKVWHEMVRTLIPGGILCINIGDATRTINKQFQLFPSHAKIISICLELGMQALPEILWRKQTNAPNKFMGSGMLPPGAYVTLEHEFILIFRKGNKREFKAEKLKQNRRESAYFWEERNVWFSDVWDFKGIGQNLAQNRIQKQKKQKQKKTRTRSAAYPFELAYRLIQMFSVVNDTVMDPFLGTGTTALAAMVAGRHSIGIEIDPSLQEIITEKIQQLPPLAQSYQEKRVHKHKQFITHRAEVKAISHFKYANEHLQCSVITGQEQVLKIPLMTKINQIHETEFEIEYRY